MSEKKKETIYEEARRVVSELNEKLYKDVPDNGPQPEREFAYTEGSYACGISIGEIDLWNSENDGRDFDELKNEHEPLYGVIVSRVRMLALSLINTSKGIQT